MNQRYEALVDALAARFGSALVRVASTCDELTYEVSKADLLEVAGACAREPSLGFAMLVDLCAVDYLTHGRGEWATNEATTTGFSRGVEFDVILPAADAAYEPRRFAVVYHLLSISHNWRLRLRVYTGTGNPPVVPSVFGVWNSADWYEREAFDLYGILFEGHPDLRRILTDYGFIGHPFRKDFPISGNVEVRYDAERGRVVNQPVSIPPRVLVPKVIRDDNRYRAELKDPPPHG